MLPFLNPDRFIEKCKALYFCIDGYTPANAIIVNGGLFYLFTEYALLFEEKDGKQDEYIRHGSRA